MFDNMTDEELLKAVRYRLLDTPDPLISALVARFDICQDALSDVLEDMDDLQELLQVTQEELDDLTEESDK